jgi:hypothetical protein
VGSTTNSTTNLILHNDTSRQFSRTGAWEKATGRLLVNMTGSEVAGAVLTLKVTLKNQATAQDAQNVMVSTSGVAINGMMAITPERMRPSKVLSSMCLFLSPGLQRNCGEGDSRPMKIYKPAFLVAEIQQDSNWPGQTNKVTIEMVTNTNLSGAMETNFSVIKSTPSPSTPKISSPVPFIVGSNRDGAFCGIRLKEVASSFVLYSEQSVLARYGRVSDKNAEHFVCVKAMTTTNTTTQNITTKLFNQGCSNVSSNSSNVSSNSSNVTRSCNETITTTSQRMLYAHDYIWSYYDGETWVTFETQPTDLLVATISNGTVVASDNGALDNCVVIGGIQSGFVANRSDIVFAVGRDNNVRVTGEFLTPPAAALMGDAAKLFRLAPHSQAFGPNVSNPLAPFKRTILGSAEVDKNAFLFLQMEPEATISLGIRTRFSFYVLNPVNKQDAPSFQISAFSGCALIEKTVMTGVALQVTQPKFIEVSAGQSSPFPCSENSVTITLMTNMHLRGVDAAKIVVMNFDGAIVGNTGTVVNILDASGGDDHDELFTNSAGEWITTDKGTLELSLALNKNIIAGREYRFSFEMHNPHVEAKDGIVESFPRGAHTEQDVVGKPKESWAAPELRLKFASTAVSLLAMEPVNIDAVTMTTTKDSLGMCGQNVSGDAAPLFVYKPQFLKAHISQSSAFPCTENSISVTIETNVPLCDSGCNAQITITNLPSVTAADGPLRLEASIDVNHQDDRDTFVASPKG